MVQLQQDTSLLWTVQTLTMYNVAINVTAANNHWVGRAYGSSASLYEVSSSSNTTNVVDFDCISHVLCLHGERFELS